MITVNMRLGITLAAGLLAAHPCRAQRVAIWDAPVPRDQLAADPAQLARLFSEHDYEVQSVSTDALLDPARVAADRVDLLVIPTQGIYPHEGLPVLEQYLKARGSFVSLGGRPFDRPLAKVDGRWQFVGLPDEPPDEVRVIADFEEGLPEGISAMSGARGQHMTCERVPDEEGRGTCLKAGTPDLQGYEYVTFDLRDTGDETYTVLHFRARGDENTPFVGIELNEEDASRWKMVLPVNTTWREYTVFVPQFLSYATEDRGGPGDYLHPERLTRLAIGFFAKLVGTGPHTLYVDDIERWRFVAPAPEAITLSRSIVDATAHYYGSYVKLPRDEGGLRRLFEDARPFEAAGLRGTGASNVCSADLSIEAPYSGWLISPSADSGPVEGDVAISRQRTARVVPILTARDPEGRELGPAVFAVLNHDGPLDGASWACFGLDSTALLQDARLAQALVNTADFLVRRPRVLKLLPSFELVDGQAAMTLTATVAGAEYAGADARVTLEVGSLEGTVQAAKAVDVQLVAGGTQEVKLVVSAERLDPAHYRAVAEVATAGGATDREAVTVDTTAVMRRMCEFFVESQRDDGAFSGHGYVDERAARGLLAMYEMTGEEEYRDAAIRWGELELREQRPDGGYRMGYGITDTGEACYVADGGEIAIGITRLVNYVPEERRQAYVESLRRYFDYRESFRMPDGSIAVGWVLNMRWMKSEEDRRVEKEMRSDRGVEFVIKCSLASASALHYLTGEAEDREMALRDARRFLQDEPTAYSTFGEAAQWAHYFVRDEDVRQRMEQCMTDTLVPFVAKPNGWWYAAAGRSGVTLGALQYYYTHIDQRPEALAGIMRGLYYMTAGDSPSGLLRVLERGPSDAMEWRYLCYASVSLAEVLDPLVTMRGISDWVHDG